MTDSLENDLFKETQKALAEHQQRIADLHEPSEETLKLNALLESLGFKHKGDFYPCEFDADDFDNTCEIGSFIIATQSEYTAILFYSEMEYWNIADSSIKTVLKAIEVVSEYELKRHVQRQLDAVVKP